MSDENDTTISESIEILNIRNGDVTVPTGESISIRGIQNGNLTIEPDGKAKITGIVNGDVTNRGGHLHLIGIIDGDLISIGGTNQIEPTAIVKGEVTEQTAD